MKKAFKITVVEMSGRVNTYTGIRCIETIMEGFILSGLNPHNRIYKVPCYSGEKIVEVEVYEK